MGIQIRKFNDKILVTYDSSNYNNCSETLVGNFEEIALNRIKNWIYKAVNLDTLNVKLADFPLVDFDITHLKKLKSIKIESAMSFNKFLNAGFLETNQFWSIENITLENIKFTIEDLGGLKASSIKLRDTNVSAKMLNQFLKSWINGEIDKNFTKMKVEMNDYKNQRKWSRVVLKDVDGINERKNIEKYDIVWARLINSNNEWAEIHLTRYSFEMVCERSVEKDGWWVFPQMEASSSPVSAKDEEEIKQVMLICLSLPQKSNFSTIGWFDMPFEMREMVMEHCGNHDFGRGNFDDFGNVLEAQ
ncbi:unnamed protein product [Caenorhabditis angaria]|uniref:Sdz-33 F-box domain-containing protein n=1 Tax=Caenorhabditis angaria TaxID=860376 RepID=A0A9P1I8G3_9PELO|nr:unnamed protein product [Caenorhabditis angaria]